MESSPSKNNDERHEELMTKMEEASKKWKEEDGEEDETDRLLQDAIDLAVQQGRGWGPGEREAYMAKILDDDFIPPIFAETQEELEASGLAEAFSALNYDDSPAVVMLDFKKKGTDAFMNGKRNEAKNVQYFRDAINHYYEAFAWAQKIEPLEQQDESMKANKKPSHDDAPEYNEKELDEMKSNLMSNAALAHLNLKNWGHVRDDSKKALNFNKDNVKAWYRLAKAYQMLQCWEEAGDAIEAGLAVKDQSNNNDLLKLQKLLAEKVRKARLARQKRERLRAERVAKVKEVWKHCKDDGIQLGRESLVGSIGDDDDEADDAAESRWHHHHPHTGQIPTIVNGEWSWPCLFVYPSHSQTDFIKHFGESEMLAMRMAEMFPELDEASNETSIPWDYNNEFKCSNLAVYFEINCPENASEIVHPESVERLTDQASTMRFYEASRALKGDEGPEMAALVTAVERKRLYKQRKAWKKKHGSLWAKPDPLDVVRVHPAMTLRDVLKDKRMVVASFLVTFVIIPENHPAHEVYLKEHKCIDLLQPKEM